MATQWQPFKTSRRICVEAMLLYIIVYQCRWCEGLVERRATIRVKVGDSISFPVSPESDQSYSVDLVFNITRIVLWSPQIVFQVHEQYKGRISMSNASIWLNKLNISDSGLYRVKIEYISGGLMEPENTYFHLQVFEPISKPNITAECLGNNVSLSCFSQGTEVTYSWETLPPCGNDSCVQLGQTIHLQLHPHHPSTTYTCTAHNPVSKASSDSTDLEKCFTSGSQGRWIPALCASSIFIVFGALVLLYMRKRQTQCKREPIQEAVMEEEPPSAMPSIDPVYVSRSCSVYLSNK
ncbi:SLAM family member 5-like isoform X2 [Conger conger]|nr:SLAM family member 5-like isoform X2 [Conger conger]